VNRAARAIAPVRLDFAGGWTDVPPFSAREGGVVVSAAIALYARAEVSPGGERIRLVAEDLGETLEVSAPAGLAADGRLDLLRAALRLYPPAGALTLTTRCDVPKGSGLGASGALDVALVGALAAAQGRRLAPRELAEQAWRLEAVEARILGGKQDQFSAALGGCNLFRFRDPAVAVEPLRLASDFAGELERRLVLCYTGASRFSGATIGRVMAEYERGHGTVVAALCRLKEVAIRMGEALAAEDLAGVGALMSENWAAQLELDPAMSTAGMARLERAMRDAGALGGKAAGSGAGGCMFFLAGDDVAAAKAAALASGAELLPVSWEPEGARLW
jgi:D-glycero-alpha-D-manno-heptose-7-phosphate kinase